MAARLTAISVACWGVLAVVASASVHGQDEVRPGAQRLDGLAAVIEAGPTGGEPSFILRSDVELWARLQLSGETGNPVLGPLPEGLLGAALEQLVGEVLIQREAQRLGLDRPSEARIRVQRRALAELAGGEANLVQLAGALGVGRRELRAIAERRATVDGFLEANLVGTQDVTTAEVESVYESGEHPFGNAPLATVSEALRSWIGQQRLQCAVRRWIDGLRQRASIRLLVSYGLTARAPPSEKCQVLGPTPGPGAVGVP